MPVSPPQYYQKYLAEMAKREATQRHLDSKDRNRKRKQSMDLDLLRHYVVEEYGEERGEIIMTALLKPHDSPAANKPRIKSPKRDTSTKRKMKSRRR